ncbi:hypothetical protein LZK98_01195 [Sphingomonas cannabina]|uniref:hypothetical protein n=1 Tax=Sphingomonas cannabina TaxID=2899123 RepID=UPI001F1A559B|nr:hypothetical protein [Sphingomonas cannabina]UIJ45610.1 hypothetical protein LZK98_01195 [Sphingomonas cannabina]
MRIHLIAAGCLVLAGCNGQPAGSANEVATAEPANITDVPADESASTGGNAAEAEPADAAVNTAALPPVAPIPPGQPGGLPDDRTPVSEASFTAESAQGAAQVVQSYYALVEQGRYDRAYALWEPQSAGMSGKAFADSFAKYAEYHAEIGAPGRIDAGAGQRYVTVPVQAYGRLKSGEPFRLRGDVTLHRAGDIDGATAEQRSWRIRSIDLKPHPSPR